LVKDNKKAIDLAVEEINSSGGINGANLRVIYEDGQCDGKQAVTAGNKLINIDQVKYILGGQCSSETLAVAPIAEASKVVMISAVSSSPDITESGNYIFRVYPSDSFQGKVAAEYIYNNLKFSKVAIMNCLGDWCVGLKSTFKANFEILGGEIVSEQEFEQESTDLRTQLTNIKNSNPDIIYMPSYTTSAISALEQANELGIEIEFFGGDAWGDSTIWESTQGISNGTMFVVPRGDATEEFKTSFETKYGADEEIMFGSTHAYDAIYVLSKALRTAGDNPIKVKDALYNVQYSGVTGDISFDEKGDLISAVYDVKIVQNGSVENA